MDYLKQPLPKLALAIALGVLVGQIAFKTLDFACGKAQQITYEIESRDAREKASHYTIPSSEKRTSRTVYDDLADEDVKKTGRANGSSR